MTSRVLAALALTVGLLAAAGEARAAEPALTVVSVPELDCPSCAKKVTAKLAAVAGVAKAEVNMEAKTFTVTPKAGAVLSPKALWEAVELANQEPTKLTGPGGTFTAKPPA